MEAFGAVNNLAEQIYDADGNKKLKLKTTSQYIHHIKEDIQFYLGAFLSACPPENILDVICTPELNDALRQTYNIDVVQSKNVNSDGNKIPLSSKGIKSIVKHLRQDYKCIEK